jgi:phosphomannomutase
MNQPAQPEPTWLARARAFRADDPDPDTQRELDGLLARAASDADVQNELRERFDKQLEFGTAGLRGLLGAGDNRMNRRVVAQTTAALCAELLQSVPDAAARGLCVGFDGRHKSREFATEVQAIANGAGFAVHAFETPAPTPLLAFAVLQRAAAGGVMITASHNPAVYNGYKVYWADGAQLNAPHDRAIAQRVAIGPSVRNLPRRSVEEARAAGLWHSLLELETRYVEALLLALGEPASPFIPRIAYTALHGVGERLARRTLVAAGMSLVESVREQAEPDPDFPSVRFPNPEEPGAMDRVLQLADHTQAELALANDPDADRLAVAVRTRAGTMVTLTGNELGVLLCDYLLARAPRDGRNVIVTTLVSTPLAAAIAAAHGARSAITLTGFKWIVRRARELEQQGLRCVLGFEEALGYCIGELVRDKDGIAAAAYVARMSQWHASRGSTLHEALEDLYRQHGLFDSRQVSLSLQTDASVAPLRERIADLRSEPPTRIAGLTVTHYQDLLRPDTEPALPPSDVLRFELEHAHRVTIRPSGTEPKLKIYLDCSQQLAASADLPNARTQLHGLSEHIAQAVRELLLRAP